MARTDVIRAANVDAESPTGATRLHESVGFSKRISETVSVDRHSQYGLRLREAPAQPVCDSALREIERGVLARRIRIPRACSVVGHDVDEVEVLEHRVGNVVSTVPLRERRR